MRLKLPEILIFACLLAFGTIHYTVQAQTYKYLYNPITGRLDMVNTVVTPDSIWQKNAGKVYLHDSNDSVVIGTDIPVEKFTVEGTSYLNGNTRVNGKFAMNVNPAAYTFEVKLNDNLFSKIHSSNSGSATWFTVSNNVSNSITLETYGSSYSGTKWGQSQFSNVYLSASGDFNIGTSNTGDMRFYTYGTYRYQWDQNGRWYVDSIPLRWDFPTYMNRSRYMVWDTVTDQVLSVPFDTLQAYILKIDTLSDGFGIETLLYNGIVNDTVVVDTTEIATLYALGDSLSNLSIGVSSITNNVDNYVLTATGTGVINGEANLTFDGSTLSVNGAFESTGNATIANNFYVTGINHNLDFEQAKYFKIYHPNQTFLIDWQVPGSYYLKYSYLGIDFFLDDSGMGLNNYSSVQVDTIETFLTDDDTHLPTSGAVYTALTNNFLTEEQVQDYAWNVLTGTQTLINVTYQDGTNDVDFVVDDDLSNYDNSTSAFLTSESDPNALLTAGTDNVKDTHLDWGTGANQISAVDIIIADAGTIITATEVEGALQENRTAIDLNTAKETNATHTGDVTGATVLTIANDAVEEVMLKAVNSPTDEYNLTYESTTGDFEWQAGVSVANQADNRMITATGTGDALNAEANLTFNGTIFKIFSGITGLYAYTTGGLLAKAGSNNYFNYESNEDFSVVYPNGGFEIFLDEVGNEGINFAAGSKQIFYADKTSFLIGKSTDAINFGLSNYIDVKVNTIEITLTDDDAHLPTSGAIIDYCAGFGTSNVSVANQADNRMITATGTGDALNAEANVSFDGTTLLVTGAVASSQTTIYTSTDALDVSGLNSIRINSTADSRVIGGLSGGITGQVVHLFKIAPANDVTFEHNEAAGTEKIYTPDGLDIVLSNLGGITVVFDGTDWFVISE